MGTQITSDVIFYTTPDEAPSRCRIHDVFDAQLTEYAETQHPGDPDAQRTTHAQLTQNTAPVYAYMPWRDTVIKTVPKDIYNALKTNRNQTLITADEQQLLQKSTITIAGMSVGSSLLFGLVGTGIGETFHIADFDDFSITNLNRVQATLLDVGRNKAHAAKQRALEMNPFLNITTYTQPITERTADAFLQHGAASIVFEEIDDFRMKHILRERARTHNIPLVMLTNLGDNVMIDIERYDVDPATRPFLGLVSDELLSTMKSTAPLTHADEALLAQRLVDATLLPERALASLKQVGKTLSGRPQLYSTVALDGGLAPYIARHIILDTHGEHIRSGRYSLRLSESLFA